MSKVKIGVKVKILKVGVFNERFVKIGDIAEVIDISDRSIELKNSNWEYTQFACNFMEGFDWELVGDEL